MNQTKSILITDKVHPFLIDELKNDGHEIDYRPKLPLSETLKIIQNHHGIVVNSKTICDQNLIDKADNLQFIGRLGSGLEIIDLNYAKAKNIHVIRTPEANCDAVAEQALGMLLSLFNNLKNANAQLKDFNWQREENRGIEIRGKTIGIIGFGHTGPAFNNLLKPFGAKIIIYDKYKAPYDSKELLEKIKNEANIISIHLPLTQETTGYINKEFIRECKNSFYLINTARGKNIILKDIIGGLNEGKILGACLDVFENEKPTTYSTAERNSYRNIHSRINVISTPHVAGWTHESLLRIAKSMLRQIREINF